MLQLIGAIIIAPINKKPMTIIFNSLLFILNPSFNYPEEPSCDYNYLIEREYEYKFLNAQERILNAEHPEEIIYDKEYIKTQGGLISKNGDYRSNDTIILYFSNAQKKDDDFIKMIISNIIENSSEEEIERFRIKSSYTYFKNEEIKEYIRKLLNNRGV